ncbi:hypothetical protein LSTR_LSTR008898 [Laodelphax striatellus]|uniref:MADF domain-containing protein n=1 Tax=Laodelphax striatellus TaxID=195883 RepID=A0A482WLG2_LAOST|nr:hypothetical protein LSTR_LSTR008898 [Laodelphax striatellus]
MSESKRWSGERIIKFLELYEQHPCLWNVHSSLYTNRKLREAAYENMAKSMRIEGFTARDVIAKIRSIRNVYTLELNKILKSKKSGAGLDDVYKPKLQWFATADRILHSVVQIKDRQSTEIIQEETNSENEHVREPSETIEPDVIVETSKRKYSNEFFQNSPSTFRPKKFKSSIISRTEKAINDLQKISMSLNQSPEDNEFDSFGKHIAAQLKKLPTSVALKSMGYIHSYLIEQRMNSCSTDSRPTSRDSHQCDDSNFNSNASDIVSEVDYSIPRGENYYSDS